MYFYREYSYEKSAAMPLLTKGIELTKLSKEVLLLIQVDCSESCKALAFWSLKKIPLLTAFT